MGVQRLNQTTMAKRAGVSQATVSRVLTGATRQRQGRAYIKLCNYIHQQNRRTGAVRAKKEDVLQAIDRIWDTSQAHATAVVKVIDALDGLRAQGREGGKISR
jgi:DNA-binding LacI/PurR family transcriptional regulator